MTQHLVKIIGSTNSGKLNNYENWLECAFGKFLHLAKSDGLTKFATNSS